MISPPPIPARLPSIQALRGLAALLVVFSHLIGIEYNHSPDQILPKPFILGIAGVDMFFVISGFIMVWVTQDYTRSAQTILKFLYARFTRIYPLYWVIAVALFCVWRIAPNITDFDTENASLAKSFLLWPDITFPMLKVAWTLTFELYFYMVFTLILCLPVRFRKIGLTLWAGLVLINSWLLNAEYPPELMVIFHPICLEFYLGACTAWLYFKIGAKKPRTVFALAAVTWIATLLYLSLISNTLIPSQSLRVILFGIPSALTLYACLGLDLQGYKFSKWSQALGDWSYSLYLSHVLTLSAFGLLWQRFAKEGAADNIIVLSSLPMLAIAVAALVYYGIERPLLRVTKTLGKKIW